MKLYQDSVIGFPEGARGRCNHMGAMASQDTFNRSDNTRTQHSEMTKMCGLNVKNTNPHTYTEYTIVPQL